jgi:glyoxylase-like metal-dependent hydrolase (beta-lactamase superfamily II)
MWFEGSTIDAGGVGCHVVIDGWRAASPRFVVKDYDEATHGPFVRPWLDEDGKLPGRFGCLLIEASDGPILVDAGVGIFAGDLDAGHLLEELAALDVRPWDVRQVVITHAHADHVGGLVGPHGEPVFADARHVLHAREAAFWSSEEASALPGNAAEPARASIGALLDADLLQTIDGDADVSRTVRVIDAPGHTPGHLAVIVNDALLWAGDSVISPLNVPHPEWISAADMDAATNEATRRTLLARAADERLVLAGSHLPVAGLIERDGGAFTLTEVGTRP